MTERQGQPGIAFRPVRRSDAAALADFYATLTPESRRRRFLGGSVPDAQRMSDFAGDPGVVGELRDGGPHDGAIVAHASVQPDGHHGAEVAFAVADEQQGHGLGRRLVSYALKLARELGADRASATMLADNVAMRHMLTAAGQPVRADRLEAGEEELVLDLRLAL
jgi:GNAT superfamily N-acetyltransferase